jgi:Na+/proline symporter
MGFSLTQVFSMGIIYLAFFFLVAYITELGYLPSRLVRHPATYVLSLGVFASAWAIYGSVGYAYNHGYNFLAYYLGMSGAYMLAPVLLAPMMRLTRTYQLASLADLFAFRYRSPGGWCRGDALHVCRRYPRCSHCRYKRWPIQSRCSTGNRRPTHWPSCSAC